MKIEKCKIIDKELLLTYIDQFWQKNHILVKNKDLFNWQHQDKLFCNFYVFKNEEKICGILGFIPTYQYDKSLAKNKDYFSIILSKQISTPCCRSLFNEKIDKYRKSKFYWFCWDI